MLSLGFLLAVAVSVGACGPSAASTARLVPQGEFRVLIPVRPSSLNPNLKVDEVAVLVGRSIFNHLLSLNEIGRLMPELAESWSTSPDGLTYTFKLRQGVRWHDGAPFTAADVKWTLEKVVADGFAGKDALAAMRDVAAPDPATVVVTLRHPWAPFAAELAGPGLAILPRHVYEGSDWHANTANERPIGTGPFKFERWIDQHTLSLAANPDYFRSGPYVHRLVFEVAPVDAIAGKLLSGDADYSVVRPSTIDLAAPPPPLVAHSLPTSARYYVAMNLRREPLRDVRVRRALAMAVDRLEIIGKALSGLGAPAMGFYTPDVEWAYNGAARVPEFDVSRARELLDAAGWRVRNGERFHIRIAVPNSPPIREVAEVLREQLRRIDITVAIERLPPPQWIEKVFTAYDFDLTVLTGGQGPDPDQLRRRFLADTDSGAYIGYDAADFREAVGRGARLVTVEERAGAYHRAQEILARDIPIIPLAEGIKVLIHNRRVSGLPQLEARVLVGSFDFSLVKLDASRSTTTQ
jgi:ABC-type transport system substrate-binding protein